MGVSYPYINGVYPTHAELSLTPVIIPPAPLIAGSPVQPPTFSIDDALGGIHSLDFDEAMPSGKVHAAGDYAPIGKVNGKYVAGASMGIYLPQWWEFQQILGVFGFPDLGYAQVDFNMQVAYQLPVMPVPVTVMLLSCRIGRGSQKSSEATQDATVKMVDLAPMYIVENGNVMFGGLLGQQVAAMFQAAVTVFES